LSREPGIVGGAAPVDDALKFARTPDRYRQPLWPLISSGIRRLGAKKQRLGRHGAHGLSDPRPNGFFPDDGKIRKIDAIEQLLGSNKTRKLNAFEESALPRSLAKCSAFPISGNSRAGNQVCRI